MKTFNVIAKDKLTGKEMTLTISAVDTADARKVVENMPRAKGGGHPGLEVVRVEDYPASAPHPAAAVPVAAHVATSSTAATVK